MMPWTAANQQPFVTNDLRDVGTLSFEDLDALPCIDVPHTDILCYRE
jgi:hypothetical protein